MACCMMAPEPLLTWLKPDPWTSLFQGNIVWIYTQTINPHAVFAINLFEITATSPRGQWVKPPISLPQTSWKSFNRMLLGWWGRPYVWFLYHKVPQSSLSCDWTRHKPHFVAHLILEERDDAFCWSKLYCSLKKMADFLQITYLKTISGKQTFVFWSSLKFVAKGIIHNQSALP